MTSPGRSAWCHRISERSRGARYELGMRRPALQRASLFIIFGVQGCHCFESLPVSLWPRQFSFCCRQQRRLRRQREVLLSIGFNEGRNELALVERFSMFVEHSAKIRRVMDFDEEVITVQVVEGTPTQFRVYALRAGVTTITVVDEHDRQLQPGSAGARRRAAP